MEETVTRNITAIHQPSFLPWLGFFNKIAASSKFVILDNVQFPKTGGYWANRVKIIISGKAEWITMPINRNYSGTKNINEIEIDNSKNWNTKILKSIEINYKKARFFDEVFPLLNEMLGNPGNSLIDLNLKIIYKLCSLLQIKTDHIIKASEITTEGNSTDLLISIIKQTGTHSYMCGGGATKYQEDHKFEEAGIKLIYQNFKHPVYQQFNSTEFQPGLSVIDAIMNCGYAKTRNLITDINP
jgi:hypothetical protein